jgi:hypothetical protein
LSVTVATPALASCGRRQTNADDMIRHSSVLASFFAAPLAFELPV